MPAKHLKARNWVATGIFDDLPSFTALETRINRLGEEKDRGDVFEIFIEGFLATQPIIQCVDHWVVGNIPLPLREHYNLPSDTKGIDGVYESRLGTHVAYQVKYRQKESLSFTKVAPFLGVTDQFVERVIFTNARGLSGDALNRRGMRLVQGDDFRALTPDDLGRLTAWLTGRPLTWMRATPKPHQTAALSDIATTLTTQDRATVVMACGSGKTLVALWATQALHPKTVVVLVPSLTLLQQTLGEWSKHHAFAPGVRYLCVCSDQTVGLKDDALELSPSELAFRIDTDPQEVRRFLTQPTDDVKVIFSTYHSSPVVGKGAKGIHFDVGIFDEAHKTTGRDGTHFTEALADTRIAIRKRLFFTATPRHIDIRQRDRDGEFRVQSMDDPRIYGPRAHTLSFARAATQGIICPYKVIISVIDKQMVSDFVRKHGITLLATDPARARWVSHLLAFHRAIERTGATKALTFHSRVKAAAEFASNTPHGIGRFLPHFDVRHVNGKQRGAERAAIIDAFRTAAKGVLTNARCLTEGVDVPAVDMVAFVDPKRSRIDIAQATGRAMRKPHGASSKTVGYIVVPLFAEDDSTQGIEDAIQSESFTHVAEVLNALQEQDEDLVTIIRALREQKGQGKPFDSRPLSEKIEVLGPRVHIERLSQSISVAIVARIGTGWDEWYGHLVAYKTQEGHCRVPPNYKAGTARLGTWVSTQRTLQKDGTLAPDRIERLTALGFAWNPLEEQWELGYAALVAYKTQEGDCWVPTNHKAGTVRLGQWVRNQRVFQKNGTLAPDRSERLTALGVAWDLRSLRKP